MTKIIGITGYKGSGKDTVADYLCTKAFFSKVSFSEKLKDIVATLFDWDRRLLEGDSEFCRLFREDLDHKWSEKLGFNVTPRKMLQQVGTKLFRDNLHPDIWIYAMEKEIDKHDAVIIPDVRFENEFKYIKSRGGCIISVERDDIIPDDHESEHIWKKCSHMIDYHIKNNKDLERLHKAVDDTLEPMYKKLGITVFTRYCP